MADNTVLNPYSGGDIIRDKDRGGAKTQIVGLDLNIGGASEQLMTGTMPVSGTVGVSGVVTVDTELTTADLDTGAGVDTRAVVGIAGAASGGAVLVQATTAGALKVDGSTVTQPVSGTVTANAGTGTFATSVADGANAALGAKADAAATTDTGTFSLIALIKRLLGKLPAALGQTTMSGSLSVAIASDQTTVTTTTVPTTSGGCSVSKLISAATTNATLVKASAGQVYGWYVANTSAGWRYVKLYNKATAPTVGTDTPAVTLAIPAGAAANVSLDNGVAFSAGIGYATTTGSADSDATAVAAGDIILNLIFK
jgi:hypothetical protein